MDIRDDFSYLTTVYTPNQSSLLQVLSTSSAQCCIGLFTLGKLFCDFIVLILCYYFKQSSRDSSRPVHIQDTSPDNALPITLNSSVRISLHSVGGDHTCDISRFRRELPIWSLSSRSHARETKPPDETFFQCHFSRTVFQSEHFIVYGSIYQANKLFTAQKCLTFINLIDDN